MNPFLKQVADHYYTSSPVEKMCFIFPNRRSMAFFTEYICQNVADPAIQRYGRTSGTAMKMPLMYTVNDFFHKAYGATPSDKVALILELYECYKKVYPNAESLDDFINWGEVILADFSDVDKYLVDPVQLFRNVAEFKGMQDDMSYLSENQREALNNFIQHFRDAKGLKSNAEGDNVKARFLMIWDALLPLYTRFNNSLRAKNMVYDGMVYRDMVEKLSKTPTPDHFKEHFPTASSFVFVGLNALNECERITLRKMQDAGMAEFCWDYSSDMLKNLRNRSSDYMKLNVEEFMQTWSLDSEGLPEPEINVISVPSSIGQAKQLPDILSECRLGSKPLSTDCAIVLPDESLLMTVLNSIPPDIEEINVTMGYPMTSGSLWALMTEISVMQLHLRKRGGSWYFYNKQVRGIFSNGVFSSILSENDRELVDAISSGTKYYIPQEDFKGSPLLERIFRPVVTDPKLASAEQVRQVQNYQLELLSLIVSALMRDPTMATEIEFAGLYFNSVNMLKSKELAIKPFTYLKLLTQISAIQSVPFVGEPLKGLQIMGPLETRALDFDNVIILSCNEGIFPKKNSSSSFIPAELRKGFGLPTNEYKDAVLAYSFYRLIQRASRVWLLYDSRMEKMRAGEESRYIKQLEYHFRKPVNRSIATAELMVKADTDSISKPDNIGELLRGLSFSASSLKNYLDCPARFYYASICGLNQNDEILESMNARMIGNVYHSTMQALYLGEQAMETGFSMERNNVSEAISTKRLSPLKFITRDYLKSWMGRKAEIKAKIRTLIKQELNTIELRGRDLVSEEIILLYVLKTLERDLELTEAHSTGRFKILGLEQFVQWDCDGHKFVGFIDRIDSFEDGTVRVVDYKTGRVDKDETDIIPKTAEKVVRKLFGKDVNDRPSIALQMFLYDKFIEEDTRFKDKSIVNVVYAVTELYTTSVLDMEVPACEEFNELCLCNLKSVLAEMVDARTPFRKTENAKNCEYCDFKNICGR